jgi:hypothetical protein
MADEGRTKTGEFETIVTAARQASANARPPIHLWNPPDCGEIDMRIAADGTWFYQGTPIGRPALVRLFASVLRREGDRYYLVTPVEKVAIRVDDAPFQAVDMRVERNDGGQALHFRTNVDDWVACGPDHGLRFEPQATAGGLQPYLHIRGGLWARLTRSVFYDLVDLGEERVLEGRRMFGVSSQQSFFPMIEAARLEELS